MILIVRLMSIILMELNYLKDYEFGEAICLNKLLTQI